MKKLNVGEMCDVVDGPPYCRGRGKIVVKGMNTFSVRLIDGKLVLVEAGWVREVVIGNSN